MSYKTELCIMTSQIELVNIFFLNFQVSNSMGKNVHIILEIFKENKISELLTRKITKS